VQDLLQRAQAWRAAEDWASAGWSSEQEFLAADRAAQWVAQLGLDQTTQAACLLYPAVLGSAPSETALISRWGDDLVGLLKGFGRLATMRGLVGRQDQVETLRRMILALSEDIRVVIARLAVHQVRLEDMAQRLRDQRPAPEGLSEEARALGQETMLVQAPLANRLGIWQLKWAMEDLAFRFTQPETYKQIAGWLDEKRVEREAFVSHTIQDLGALMAQAGLTAEVAGRPKHLYSIYNKMRQKQLTFDGLRDLRAFRILVSTEAECYDVLAQLHAAYRPMTDEFDDYIVRPKANGYQSLHTVLLDDQDRPFEVQVRTHDMHLRAEYGVAAHWRYKETGGSAAPKPKGSKAEAGGDPSGHEAQIQWLRQMLDWGQAVGQVRLSSDRIYVLTPRARIVELPAGATALDFAYALHTELGHRCRGAKVNGHIVTLQTPLLTGQTVELLTVKQGAPSRDWLQPELGVLKTHRARSKVRAYFNALDAEEKSAAAAQEGTGSTAVAPLSQAESQEQAQALEQSLLARVSRVRPTTSKGQVLVVGVDRMLTHFAKCCHPLPPDPILGFVTKGRGVSVHRASCKTLAGLQAAQPDRVIETSWGSPTGVATHAAHIRLEADRRDGFMRLFTETLIKERVSLGQMRTHQVGELLSLSADCQVQDLAHLEHCLAALRGLPGVRLAVRDQ